MKNKNDVTNDVYRILKNFAPNVATIYQCQYYLFTGVIPSVVILAQGP